MSSESMKLKISKGIKILYIYKNGKQEKKNCNINQKKMQTKSGNSSNGKGGRGESGTEG